MILKRQPARRGTTIVEVAFVALVCVGFMLAIFEYGRYVFMRQVMENAARAGAREAVVTATSYVAPATADATLRADINATLVGQPLVNQNLTIYQADDSGNNVGPWTSTPFGRNIVVQIDGELPLLFPFFRILLPWQGPPGSSAPFLPSTGTSPNSIHITVKAIMRGEAN
jgi:Flp pilus assembly protein TadG